MPKRTIDFSHLIKELNDAGVTKAEIARAVGVTGPHISHIAAGRVKEPTWAIGDWIIRRHAEVFRATP